MPKESLSNLLYDIRRIAEHREKLSEKRIKAIYQSLMKDLDSFIADGYKKYADDEGRFYISYLDAQNDRAMFLEKIVENVDSIQPELREEMLSLIDDTRTISYKGMVESLKKAKTPKEFEAIAKDIKVNPNVLKSALNNNISKLTLPVVLQQHRGQIIYQIQQELNIGLMQGERYEKMAKRISERVGVSQSKAMNIVRTESHRNVESGFMDCAEHLSEGLEGSDLIYAATWRTMDDERVRPQVMRKTKSGWKKSYNKNGADHIKMEGVTVKVGELFNLGNGVKAKAPSQSGVAAHDCNCRCFLEYNLMTPEEFAKATGKAVKSTEPKAIEKPVLKISDYPDEFTKGAEGKNTQKLIDYINNIEGADPNALKLYGSLGKLENISSNGIPFKITHGKNHAVNYTYSTATHKLREVKINYPKLTGDNFAGQVNTTLHEQMHLLDLYGRKDVEKYNNWFSSSKQSLVNTFRNTNADIGEEIKELFTKHNAEYHNIRDKISKAYDKQIADVKYSYLQGKSPWEDMKAYRLYEKEANKLRKKMYEEMDYESRNIMGGGVCNLQDIYDALSGGKYRNDGVVIYGHGAKYYARPSVRVEETIANYSALSVTRPDLIKMLRKDKPELCKELDELIKELVEKAGV